MAGRVQRWTAALVGAGAVATAVAVLVADGGTSAVEPTTSLPEVTGHRSTLVWSDEFDGAALDTSVWEPYHNTYGDGNDELQCHTPDNVSVSDGTLKITARRETVTCPTGSVRDFTAGFLGTRETGTYFPRFGRFEIRARIPHGQGLWPAFWLRHRDGAAVAEVNVMESFHAQLPGRSSATLHLDGRSNLSKATVAVERPAPLGDWHTWTVDIEEVAEGVRFTFYLDSTFYRDGAVYHRFIDTEHRWAELHPGEGLWDIAVNLSVGGRWVGEPDDPLGYLAGVGRCAQTGEPPDCPSIGIRPPEFPATFEIDYVRVYELH